MYMTGYNKSSEFGTPTTFFNHYNRIFNFDLDVAASDKNHKCDMYFTEDQDGLKQIGVVTVYGAIRLMDEKYTNG